MWLRLFPLRVSHGNTQIQVNTNILIVRVCRSLSFTCVYNVAIAGLKRIYMYTYSYSQTLAEYPNTVQSKRKFTLASARHASPRNITRARIASPATNTRNEKQCVDKKYLAAKKVHSLLSTQSVLFRSLTMAVNKS